MTRSPEAPERGGPTSLVWASPFMVFFVFPVLGAVEYGLGRPLGAALLAATIGMILVYVASWLINPVAPARRSVSLPFALTSAALAVLQIAMAVVIWAMGSTGAAYMVTFIAAAWVLQAPRRLILPGASLTPALALAESLLTPGNEVIFPLVAVGMTALFCLLVRSGIAREARERLDHRRALALSREAERSRISSDLHDILGQTLTGITVKADLAGRLLDAGRAETARTQIDELTELSREALADVRAVVARTRAMLPETEVEAARDLLDAAGVRLDVARPGEPAPGAPSSLVAHTIREGVTNALAHAEPTRIDIEIRGDGVRVTNDGYSPRKAQTTAGGGSGLEGLRARAAQDGPGTVTWGPVAGRRWALELRLR